MLKVLFLVLISLLIVPIYGQQGFLFEEGVNRVKIPFKIINNLIFVPIKVNGTELNFLLDTGVSETILFSLEEKKDFRFINVEKVILRGLGNQTAVEGLKSQNNVLECGGLKMSSHLLYIVLDPEFNLSSHIGIPVNGIIGNPFFRNNLVEINYRKKHIIVYRDIQKNQNKIQKKFSTIPITIEKSKPYLKSKITLNAQESEVKLLIDIGNSDAVWLFEDSSKNIAIPQKNFDDFLGKGFSGDIEGKRGKIEKFNLAEFEFKNLIAAFPDSISIKNVTIVTDRMGSVGGEVMKRFNVVFDYKNQKLFLKKNGNFSSTFSYNKSGIEVQHNGLQWVQETVPMETIPLASKFNESEVYTTKSDFKYKFQLKPVYEIAHVRKNSSAAKAGLLKGDVIIKINHETVYKLTLEHINAIFRSETDKWINLEIEREDKILIFRFQLEDVL